MDFKKNALLNTQKLAGYDFDRLSSLLKNDNYVLSIRSLLNQVLKNNIGLTFDKSMTKKFLSSYMFINHLEIVTNGDNYAVHIKELASEMVFSLDRIFENNMGMKYINEFMTNYEKYSSFFNRWKMREGLIMAREPIKTYINYKNLRTRETDKEKKEHYTQIMKKLRENIYLLSGDEGIRCLNENKIPVFKDEKVFSDVEKTVRQAFWDVVRENFKENKNEQLITLLEDLKQLLIDTVQTKDFTKELEEFLDLAIIKNMIDNNLLNLQSIQIYTAYLISIVKKIQAPADDQDTKLFEENVNNKIKNNEEMCDVLTYFFETMFAKVEKIKEVSDRFREAIKTIKKNNK
jgi:hypothetical protein